MSVFDLSRSNRTPLGKWWWTVDWWILVSLFLLLGIGVLFVLAASPAVAQQHAWSTFYFVKRHLILFFPSVLLMVGISLLNLRQIRRLALMLFGFSLCLLVAVLVVGAEIKGARRWMNVLGFSLQPSEFIKPALIILCAWMFSEQKKDPTFPGNLVAMFLYGLTVVLFMLQPDLGMVVLTTTVWFVQFFLAGLSMVWVVLFALSGAGGLLGAYLLFPHVTSRIDRFLNAGEGDRFGGQFQVHQSLEAFSRGGFLGQGPGEGTVKKCLPDAHADFIFAVGAEEFGILFCLGIVLIYAFIVLRCLFKLFQEHDLFALLATAGLACQLGLQAIINMASTLHLIPPKGMTLPFISYGGSSLLAISIGMGMLLSLTRRRIEGLP